MWFYFLHNSYEGFNVSQTGIQKLMAIVKNPLFEGQSSA